MLNYESYDSIINRLGAYVEYTQRNDGRWNVWVPGFLLIPRSELKDYSSNYICIDVLEEVAEA